MNNGKFDRKSEIWLKYCEACISSKLECEKHHEDDECCCSKESEN